MRIPGELTWGIPGTPCLLLKPPQRMQTNVEIKGLMFRGKELKGKSDQTWNDPRFLIIVMRDPYNSASSSHTFFLFSASVDGHLSIWDQDCP